MKKLLNYSLYSQKEILEAFFFNVDTDDGRFVINCNIDTLVMAFRTIHGKMEISKFIIENREIICKLVKNNCTNVDGPLYNIKLEEKIEKARVLDALDFLETFDSNILRCFFDGIFISFNYLFELMKFCKNNLKDESTFLTKEEFDAALLDEFYRNIGIIQFKT